MVSKPIIKKTIYDPQVAQLEKQLGKLTNQLDEGRRKRNELNSLIREHQLKENLTNNISREYENQREDMLTEIDGYDNVAALRQEVETSVKDALQILRQQIHDNNQLINELSRTTANYESLMQSVQEQSVQAVDTIGPDVNPDDLVSQIELKQDEIVRRLAINEEADKDSLETEVMLKQTNGIHFGIILSEYGGAEEMIEASQIYTPYFHLFLNPLDVLLTNKLKAASQEIQPTIDQDTMLCEQMSLTEQKSFCPRLLEHELDKLSYVLNEVRFERTKTVNTHHLMKSIPFKFMSFLKNVVESVQINREASRITFLLLTSSSLVNFAKIVQLFPKFESSVYFIKGTKLFTNLDIRKKKVMEHVEFDDAIDYDYLIMRFQGADFNGQPLSFEVTVSPMRNWEVEKLFKIDGNSSNIMQCLKIDKQEFEVEGQDLLCNPFTASYASDRGSKELNMILLDTYGSLNDGNKFSLSKDADDWMKLFNQHQKV